MGLADKVKKFLSETSWLSLITEQLLKAPFSSQSKIACSNQKKALSPNSRNASDPSWFFFFLFEATLLLPFSRSRTSSSGNHHIFREQFLEEETYLFFADDSVPWFNLVLMTDLFSWNPMSLLAVNLGNKKFESLPEKFAFFKSACWSLSLISFSIFRRSSGKKRKAAAVQFFSPRKISSISFCEPSPDLSFSSSPSVCP